MPRTLPPTADSVRPLTVGILKDAIADLADETPVLAHAGWDFPIHEWDVDADGFIVFLEDDDTTSMVSADWLSNHIRGTRGGAS